MGRQKKIKSVQTEIIKPEVKMSSELAVLEPPTQEAELETLQGEIDLARVELERTKLEIEEKKRELVFSERRRELDKDEQNIATKQISRTSEVTAKLADLQKQKQYDSVKVTGKFLNIRAPGQPVKLPYMKYAEDPVKWHPFEHGKVYTIPRGFADQINEYYHVPKFTQREGVMDPNVPCSQIQEVDTSNKKYAFVPVGF